MKTGHMLAQFIFPITSQSCRSWDRCRRLSVQITVTAG